MTTDYTDTNDPDQIRREIESTRGDLSANVNALAESVKPGNVARRQVDKVMGGAADLKDKVMGAADDATSSTGNAAGSVKDAAGAAPNALRRGTRCNPVAAGLIAFGLGWLVASLIPASSAEQQAAAAVKSTATDAAATVKDEASSSAQNVTSSAQGAVGQVKDRATS